MSEASVKERTERSILQDGVSMRLVSEEKCGREGARRSVGGEYHGRLPGGGGHFLERELSDLRSNPPLTGRPLEIAKAPTPPLIAELQAA